MATTFAQLPNNFRLDLKEVLLRPDNADFEDDWSFVTNPQLPQVVLARVNADGQIPSTPFTLYLRPGFSVVYLDYEWYVEYPFNGRRDKSKPVKGRVHNTSTIQLDFGSSPQGGIWRGTFGGIFRHTDGWQGPGTGLKLVSSVRGTNPERSEIRSRLGALPAQIRAYKESRFRQFGPDEMPLFGPPRGFGVMQIDNPPATARQVWNWIENVEAGLALIRKKERETEQHYNNIYNKDPTIPKLTADQMKLAEYQYYNGGWYWGWNTKEREWKRITKVTYADDAVELERQIADGNFPPDW